MIDFNIALQSDLNRFWTICSLLRSGDERISEYLSLSINCEPSGAVTIEYNSDGYACRNEKDGHLVELGITWSKAVPLASWHRLCELMLQILIA